MKYPNHLILDVFSAKFNLISNWNINYQLTKINNSLLNEFDVLVKFTKNIYSKQNFKNEKTIKNDNLWSIFDIFFLKKEKIYTKLKYSRTPQYDIVSGGVAAIFSGFLGFLICEKFGFELLDSGDFYFLFMYAVFFFFFSRLFLKNINTETGFWSIISLKWLFFFLKNLITLLINKWTLAK